MDKDIAQKLNIVLKGLPGVQKFEITVETQELYIMFDENQLGFQSLAEELARAGCSLRNINAALIM